MEPVAYTISDLPAFISHVSQRYTSPTLLIVCSNKQSFIDSLQHSIGAFRTQPSTTSEDPPERREPDRDNQDQFGRPDSGSSACHTLLTRTLRRVAQSRHVRFAFCPSVQALRAYLSTLPNEAMRHSASKSGRNNSYQLPPALIFVSLIAVHRGFPSFTAQNLSETLAWAVEAATRSNLQLLIVEPQGQSRDGVSGDEDTGTGDTYDNLMMQRIPILTATTKIFGTDTDRSTLSSSVTVKRIIERWCQVQNHILTPPNFNNL